MTLSKVLNSLWNYSDSWWYRVPLTVGVVAIGSEIVVEAYQTADRLRKRLHLYLYEKFRLPIIEEVIFTSRMRQYQPMDAYISQNINSIAAVLDRAHHSISLCLYSLSLTSIIELLIRAKRDRAVKVKIILCSSQSVVSKAQIEKLTAVDISVRYVEEFEGIMHNKFCIVDSPWYCEQCTAKIRDRDQQCASIAIGKVSVYERLNEPDVFAECGLCQPLHRKYQDTVERLPPGGVLLGGSANWTAGSIMQNIDSVLITSHQQTVASYQVTFRDLWMNHVKERPVTRED